MNFDPHAQLTATTTEFTSEVVFNGISEHNKCMYSNLTKLLGPSHIT